MIKISKSARRFCSMNQLGPNGISDMHLHQKFHMPIQKKSTATLFEADLQWGEIPLELSYDRKSQTTILENGISVTTVEFISPIVTLSVFIKCGSVNEKEVASGVAHFLEHMHFKGTSTRTRQQLELEIENHGAHLNAYTTRDYTSYILNVFQDKVDWAVEFLADILINSRYDHNLIERERGTIETELLECQKEEFETILENSHMTAFKGHSIARPILGLVENIKSVTRQQIVDFHDLNYTGENILLVASGNVEHKRLKETVDRVFKRVSRKRTTNDPELIINLGPPTFVPRTSIIDGPEGSLKVGVYWQAPSWSDSDYVAFLVLQRIMGDYEPMDFEPTQKSKSLSDISTFLSQNQRIRKFRSGFVPYKHSGLFGCFIEGEASSASHMTTFVPTFVQDLKNNINDEDVLKIRSNLFSELMMIESGNDITQDVGCYLVYLNRVVTKSEMAKRISLSCNTEFLRSALDRWICGKPYALTLWGNKKEMNLPKNYMSRN